MSRRKVIIGAIVLVLVSVMATSAVFLYFLQKVTPDLGATLRLFQVMHMIKNKYVEDVPADTLIQGALKGMVNSVGDPHSIYMDAKLYKEFMSETEGAFGGVGIVVGLKDKVLTVISPIEGTPGEKAGIKSGDQILKIDGVSTTDMPLDQAVGKIRGPEGTQVTLTLRRGTEAPKDYPLVRSNIKIQSVAGKMLPSHIGYIRISTFNESTSADFQKKYQELEREGMKGLVLDLRDNPGGLLEECVKVANYLVPKGTVVSVVGRDGTPQVYTSNLEMVKYPLVVLVNGGSASASEIVSGAVQDTGAGTLIGTKTFGKGSVQSIFRIGDGTAVKLTIAKYLTPNGRSINGIGIEPDVKLELTEKAGAEMDNQLEKAVEVVSGKLK